MQRGCSDLSRATWAVVQLDEQRRPKISCTGPVWSSLPQTAQAAEHCARAAAVQLLVGPTRLIGDCKNVVRAAQLPARE
eukprot:2169134-Karenia_brevis.AAC.1